MESPLTVDSIRQSFSRRYVQQKSAGGSSIHDQVQCRSAVIMNILSYNAVIHLVGFIAIACVPELIIFGDRITHETWNLATICVAIILIPGTISVLTTLSPMVTSLPPRQRHERSWKTLYLCLVSKGTNRETVFRSISTMRHLQQHNIRLILLTEEGRDFDASQLGCDVLFVPRDFDPPLARYKARMLEYFRLHQKLQDDHWVLHLDEETLVDDHCIRACIDFIERTLFEWGQGLLTYNDPVNYWTNPVLTFAEILRFKDDLGRFMFQHGRVHKTIWGCHGSFLLSSGKVENAVTWNTECLAEDFCFANKASTKFGYGGGFIPSVAREQCNFTVMDFLNQRRRWFCGMWKVGFFGQLMSSTWLLSTLEFPMAVFYYAGCYALPSWVRAWMGMYIGAGSYTILVAIVVQDIDAGVSVPSILWHLLMTPVLSILVQGLQTTAIVYSIVSPPTGFHIVAKK